MSADHFGVIAIVIMKIRMRRIGDAGVGLAGMVVPGIVYHGERIKQELNI